MSSKRIGVADESEEGRRVVEALRARDFDVVEVALEEVSADLDVSLLVLAGDVPGALEKLTATRGVADTSVMPIVLLGTPALDDPRPSRVLALGADAHYERPVPLDRLLRKIETYLAPAQLRLSGPPVSEPGPSREATVQLDASKTTWTLPADGDAAEASIAAADSFEGLDAFDEAAPDAGERGARKGTPTADAGGPQRAARPSSPPIGPVAGRRAETASVSPRLHELLRAADRRVFPDHEPLEIAFPAASQSAEKLVPDELLDIVSLPVEPAQEDPLEAFTYVWAAPESLETTGERSMPLGAAAFQRSAPSRELSQEAPRSVIEVTQLPSLSEAEPTGRSPLAQPRSLPDFGDPSPDAQSRGGEIFAGDALRAALALADARAGAVLRLEPADASPIVLRAAGGMLTGLEGPVALRTLEALVRDGRADRTASDEARAVRSLERRVDAGLLSRFELDRRLRRAREGILREIVAIRSGRFTLALDPHAARSAPLFSRPLAAILVEAARQRVDASALRELVGSDVLTLRLADSALARFRAAELEPELVALVERHDGGGLSALLSAAPSEEGVAGVVFALVCWGAARLDARAPTEPRPGDGRAAARSLIESAAALASDGHYFAILGAEPGASTRELSQAYLDRRQELERLDLPLLGLTRLEAGRDAALQAVDEAWEVLRRERWRGPYRRALGL